MSLSAIHISSVVHKELRDYRRNRFIIATMSITPLVFLGVPIATFFSLPASVPTSLLQQRLGFALLYMLLIPAIVPAALSAYSIVGERDQGTLEPLLTTPIRREELILGKAAAALIPSVTVAYGAFGIYLAAIELFAHANVSAAVFDQGPVLLAQVIFTPLLAGWAVWIGIAISARSRDVRVAQQLGTLASLPPLAIVALMAVRVITPSFTLAFALAFALLAIDLLAWRLVSAIFDREWLITGARASASAPPILESTRKSGVTSATLRLSRQFRIMSPTKFTVVLDGTEVGTIANHANTEIPIETGTHTLQLLATRPRLFTSPTKSFIVTDGETADFVCHARGPLFLAGPWAIASLLINHSWWIVLKRAG
jgi:ABC-2 type transport system permease protein